MIVGTNIVLGLVQQWIFPSVVNSLIPFSVMYYKIRVASFKAMLAANGYFWVFLDNEICQ